LISMRNSGPRVSTKYGAYFELLKITVTGGPPLAKTHQLHPVILHGNSAVSAGCAHLEPQFIFRSPGHDSVTIADAIDHLFPDGFAHLARIRAHINTRPDFQQPDGQPAAQTRRSIFKHDDQHHPCFLRLAMRGAQPQGVVQAGGFRRRPTLPQCQE